MSASGSRRLGALMAVLVILAALGVSAVGTPPAPVGSSARSTAPEGRRALELLLDELGWSTDVWADRPSRLPRERLLLVLPGVPDRAALSEQVGEDPADRALVAGPHSPYFYRRFVDEGGVLLVPATDECLRWLVQDLAIEELGDVERRTLARRPDEVLCAGELLALGEGPRTALEAEALGPRATTLVETPAGDALALSIAVGRGTVALVLPADLFDNGTIGTADRAVLAVRLIEELAPRARVLFDDYAAGAWSAQGPIALALGSALAPSLWHALALGLALVWCAAWAGAFPRDVRRAPGARPIARAEGIASLWLRAGRADLLARELRRDARVRLERELGVSAASGADALADRLGRLARRTGRDGALDGWIAALAGPEPRTPAELRSQARRLAGALDAARR